MGTRYDSQWYSAIGQAAVEGIIEGLGLPSPSPRRRAQAYLNTRRTDQRRARRMDRLSSVRSHMSFDLILALMAAELIEETEGAGLLNADYGDESND